MAKKKTKLEKKIAESKKLDEISFKIMSGYIKDICKLVKTLRGMALFEFSKDSGLTVKFIDPQHTRAGTILMSNKAFYGKVKMNKKEITFGVKIADLDSIVKLADQYETIEFSLVGTQIKMTVGNLHRSFEILDSSDTPHFRTDEVNLEHDITFDIDSGDLKQAIKHTELVGHKLTIRGSEHLLIIEGDDGIGDSVEGRFISKEAQEQTGLKTYIKDPKTVDSSFEIDVIKPIVEVAKKEVKLHMGESVPIAIEWFPQDNMGATFFVAPCTKTE